MIKPTVSQLSARLTIMNQTIYHTPETLKGRVFAAYRQKVIQELTDLFQNHKSNTLIKNLRLFLARNWNLVKNNSGTSLSYTALPNNEITDVLCDIAQVIKEADNNPKECALQILMPTLTIDSISPEYPALDALDIRQVLKTHIVGKEGKYLIPVQQFISLQGAAPKKWMNCYFDYRAHQEEMIRLNQEEYERLGRHSPETIALRDAYLQYELSLNEQGSLLAHLKQLCRFLYFNSVNGIGKETNAGTGTYDAIIQFNEYYRRLDDSSKNQIPPKVKTEIDLILNLSSNKDVNKDATANMDTCIATRREQLEKVIKPEENSLAGIGLSAQNKARLTDEKKKHLEHCQSTLKETLAKKNYAGQDSLGLTIHLIRTLNAECSITSFDDVRDFMALQPDELKELCQDEELQKQFISQFKTIETLVFFILETPIAQLKVILSLCAQRLAKKLLRSSEDLCALLITLNKERSEIVCQLMKGHIRALIKNTNALNSLLEPLPQDQRTCIYQVMEDRLPALIKDGFGFNDVCCDLSADQRDAVYGAMKTRWPALISNGREFKKVFEVLSPIQHNEVYALMSPHWLTLITKSYDFQDICHAISADQRLSLYNTMKDHLPSLSHHVVDLVRILDVLEPHQCIEFAQMMATRWAAFVKDRADIVQLLKELSPDNRITIYIRMKKHIWSFIKQYYDFQCIQKLFADNPTHLKLIYEDMKNHLPSLIKHLDDFIELFKLTPAEEYSHFYKTATVQIHQVIQHHYDLARVFKTFTPKQATALCLALNNQLSSIIKNKQDLEHLLKELSLEQCTIFGRQFKECLPKIIKNISDVKSIMTSKSLTDDKRELFYTLMKDHFPNMIKNGIDFLQLIESCPKHIQDIFNTQQGNWQKVIKTSADFSSVLIPLSVEQCAKVFNAMKEHLPSMIKNSSDFEEVLRNLTPDQRTAVYKSMENRLVSLIKTANDFRNILVNLPPEQRTVIYRKMRRRLPSLIKTSSDFVAVLECLSPDQRTAVYLKKKKSLQLLLKENEDFFWILSVLPPKECTELCATMNAHLLEAIEGADPQLTVLLEPLSLEQCIIVFQAIKNPLLIPKLNAEIFNQLLQHLSSEQCIAFCRVIKNHLPAMGLGIQDFSIIQANISIDKYTVVFNEIKEVIASMLKDSLDVKALIQPLSVEKCSLLCRLLKPSLAACIKDSYDFEQIFEGLSPEQQHSVYSEIKDILPLIIKNGQDFNRVYRCLPIQDGLLVVEMTPHLTRIIKNNHDLKWVLQVLTPNEFELLMVIHSQLPMFLKNMQDWSRILKSLSVTQCETVCELMKHLLTARIKNKHDLATLLSPLPPTLYPTIYKKIKDTFLQLVSFQDLKPFLSTLPTDKQRKKIQQILVEELVEKIKAKAAKINPDSDAYITASILTKRLAEASQLYFVKERIDYPHFKNLCQKTIEDTADLNNDWEWADLLATLVLTVLSLGAIPVVHKLMTGYWTLHFFKSNDELAVDTFLDEANHLVC